VSEQLRWVRVGGGEPVEAAGVRLRLAPGDYENALEALTLHDFDLAFSGDVSGVMAAWFAELASVAGREQRLARARDISRAWSGPSRLERRIAAAYGVPWRVLSGMRPSALNAEYRRRQKNRVKRRRR
jgi:hypothetical protein